MKSPIEMNVVKDKNVLNMGHEDALKIDKDRFAKEVSHMGHMFQYDSMRDYSVGESKTSIRQRKMTPRLYDNTGKLETARENFMWADRWEMESQF